MKEQELARKSRGEKSTTIEFIRWSLPKEWLETRGSYEVDPRDWGFDEISYPGVRKGAEEGEWDATKGWGRMVMSDEEEEGYSYSGSDPPKADVKIWFVSFFSSSHQPHSHYLLLGHSVKT